MADFLLFCGTPILVIVWLIFLLATIDNFYRKGYNAILGLVVALALPVIGLIVSLIMPYDQELLAERRSKEEERAAYLKQNWEDRLKRQRNRPTQPEYIPANEPPIFTNLQTVFASLLIVSLLIPSFQPGETVTGILGLVSLLSLLGMAAAMLIPIIRPAKS